jgi:hypothetical protein
MKLDRELFKIRSISGAAERDQNFTESIGEEKMSLKSMEGSEFEEPTEENKTGRNKRKTEGKKEKPGKTDFGFR